MVSLGNDVFVIGGLSGTMMDVGNILSDIYQLRCSNFNCQWSKLNYTLKYAVYEYVDTYMLSIQCVFVS